MTIERVVRHTKLSSPFLQVPRVVTFHSPSVPHCIASAPNKENPLSQWMWTTAFDGMLPADMESQFLPFDKHSDPLAGGSKDEQSENKDNVHVKML